MRKIYLILLASLLAGSLYAQSTAPTDMQAKIQNIDFVKRAGFSVLEVKKVGDTYVVKATHPRMPKAILFVSNDFKVVVVGTGFTAKGEKIDFPVNMKQYKNDAAYTYGNGTTDYYMFTDPECPYCQRLEKNLVNMKKDIKLHVFLFPLSFHKHAVAMTKYVLSKKTSKLRAEEMLAIAKGSQEYKNAKISEQDSAKYQKIIDNNTKIATTVGVRGTPSIFTETGKAINWPDILTKRPQ